MNSLHAALVLMEFKQAIKGLFRHAPKQCMVVSQPILVHRFLILVSWLTESRNIDDRHEKIQIKLIHRKKEKSIWNLEIFRGKRFSITKIFFLFSILFISTSPCRHMIFKVKYVFQRTIFNSVSDIFCKLGPYYNCDT